MKKYFSDEQNISILREAEAGGGYLGTMPQIHYFGRYFQHLTQEIWRHGIIRSEAAQAISIPENRASNI